MKETMFMSSASFNLNLKTNKLTLLDQAEHPLTTQDLCFHDLSPDGQENPAQIKNNFKPSN